MATLCFFSSIDVQSNLERLVRIFFSISDLPTTLFLFFFHLYLGPPTLTADFACFPQAMYESTINLIYALTSIAAVSSVNSGKGEYVDALVRARIFWSGILHDWMVNGLRGGRMFL